MPYDGTITWSSDGSTQESGWKICTTAAQAALENRTMWQPAPLYYFDADLLRAMPSGTLFALCFGADAAGILGLLLLLYRRRVSSRRAASAVLTTTAADTGAETPPPTRPKASLLSCCCDAASLFGTLVLCLGGGLMLIISTAMLVSWLDSTLRLFAACSQCAELAAISQNMTSQGYHDFTRTHLAGNAGECNACYRDHSGTGDIIVSGDAGPVLLVPLFWAGVLLKTGGALGVLGAFCVTVLECCCTCGVCALCFGGSGRESKLLSAMLIIAIVVTLWSAIFIPVSNSNAEWYANPKSHIVALTFGLLDLIPATALLLAERDKCGLRAVLGGAQAQGRWRTAIHSLVLLATIGLTIATVLLFSLDRDGARWYSVVGAILCTLCALINGAFCVNLLRQGTVSTEEKSLLEPRIDELTKQLEEMQQQQAVLVEMLQAQAGGVGDVLRLQGGGRALPGGGRSRARVDPTAGEAADVAPAAADEVAEP